MLDARPIIPQPDPQRTPFATMTAAYVGLKVPLTRAAGLILDLTAVYSRGHMVRPNGEWGGAWWRSVPGIAGKIGCSERTVQRALRELAAAGLVMFVQTKFGYRLRLTEAVKRALAEATPTGPPDEELGEWGGVTILSPSRKERLGTIVALGVVPDSPSQVEHTPEQEQPACQPAPGAWGRGRGPRRRSLGGLARELAPALRCLGGSMGDQTGRGPIDALRRSMDLARAQPIALLEFHRRGFDLTLVEYRGYLEAVEGGRFDNPERLERQGKTVSWLRYLELTRPERFPAWANEARDPCLPPGRKG